MIIRPIGQSGYIIKSSNTKLAIDPYLSDVVNRTCGRPRMLPAPMRPNELDVDAVICTHNHLDHIDTDSIPDMDNDILFISTNDGAEKIKQLGKNHVKALEIGESVAVGDFTVTAVYAKHTVNAFGIILKAEEKTLYFSGDTLFCKELFEISKYKPYAAFICINGKLGNMNVDEAVITAKKIGAKINIPNHYDMFASNTEDPKLFTENVNGGMIMEFNKEYEI